MKLKIKIKRLNKNIELPKVINKGEWIDLRASKDIVMCAPQASTLKRHKENGKEVSHRDVTFDFQYIPLGVAMEMPEGYEAELIVRSSTPGKLGIISANSIGLIDNTYNGDTDEWKLPALAFRDTEFHQGERICQFRIQLSQKATMWQKIKWLFSSGIKIIEVDKLNNNNRGGFGSTGVN